MREITAADLFCGAGGTSTGMYRAATERGIGLDLLAINHWQVAVDTHKLNHPEARHLCADLASIDPNAAFGDKVLDVLVASPECTHMSLARGGKPCSDQSRASAWHVLHWAERLRPRDVVVENVREFMNWGPLLDRGLTHKKKKYEAGRPDPRRKGETFQAFVKALESLGYAVEWRLMNAADYGDATSRLRLFLQASRQGPVTWPEPTHRGRHRPASEIIDWDLKGTPISERKRPLAPKTMARIEQGLRKFGGEAFIAVLRGTSESHRGAWAKPMHEPLTTVSAGGVHSALCQPFVLGKHSGGSPRPVTEPVPTVCATTRGMALCQPFVVPMANRGKGRLRPVSETLPTITTSRGGDMGLAEPFLTKYYGKSGSKSVTEPLDTVTAKDKFAVVEPCGVGIRFRMLQPHELAAAMGFGGYRFCGNKTEQVRQIGNAVAVGTAKALCGAVMDRRR